MKHIKIFDTTLRDGEQSPGCSMHLAEKLEVARQLERLGVDIIEAGFAVSSQGDFESVKSVAQVVKDCQVASLARAVKGDIDSAYEALKHAAAPRIHIFLATSPLHREFKLKMSKEQILAKIRDSISYAKTLLSDIEFSAEDACRTELPFLAECMEAAIESGATVLNVPDTVGYCAPSEVFEKIRYLIEHVKGIDRVDISAHNHDDLGLATANSLSMILAGATQVECTVTGIGERAGNTSLEQVVMGLKTRPAFYNADTRINTQELYKSAKLISTITGNSISPTKPIIGANAFAHESGIHQHGVLANRETYEIMNPTDVGIPQNKIVLGKHSGRHAFEEHCKTLGYRLTPEQINEKFDAFKHLTDRKKYVSDRDLEALLSGTERGALKYALVDYQISTARSGDTQATVSVSVGDEVKTMTATGNGPVDASYCAIEEIFGEHVALADYSVHSVTEAADAQGEAGVKLTVGDTSVRGRGVSTDVLEASILAYIDGLNKIVTL